MSNPFPGMNPYLEAYRRDIHASLSVYIRDAIQDQLPDDLYALVEEEIVINAEDERRMRCPDVFVSEDPVPACPRINPAAEGVAVAEPLLILADDPEIRRHIEIRETATGNRVVTAIELLSPSNKLLREERRKYLAKQSAYAAGDVNLVEIELTRDGDYVLAAPLHKIAPSERTPYAICVRRATDPQQFEIYRVPLRERLPAFPIPLRADDTDVVLDLQPLINQCYDRGRYARIDYRREPEPPLTEDDAAWCDRLLREKGLR